MRRLKGARQSRLRALRFGLFRVEMFLNHTGLETPGAETWRSIGGRKN